MIGRLRGILIEKQAPHLMIDVHGVGYELQAPMTSFYELPEVGMELSLHTHLVVREDAQQLYGFVSAIDKQLFRILIKVSGVGAKLALALLSNMSANDFVMTIRSADVASLTRVPGVGKKTAERLVIEMKDRLKDWVGIEVSEDTAMNVQTAANTPIDSVKDAISALVALGYKPTEASRMVSGLETEGLASEELIRQALKSMAV